jgi:putative resolvase
MADGLLVMPFNSARHFTERTVPAVAEKCQTVARAHCLGQPGWPRGAVVGGVGLYARVSSIYQRDDLDRQVARMSQWAAQSGSVVVRVEAELGSGMNGALRKVQRAAGQSARGNGGDGASGSVGADEH